MGLNQSSIEHTASDYDMRTCVPKDSHVSVVYSHETHEETFGKESQFAKNKERHEVRVRQLVD